MKISPIQYGNLFLLNDCSNQFERLVLKVKSEIWFFCFSQILCFEVNTNLSIVEFYIENKRIWFQYAPTEKSALLELFKKHKYKIVNKNCYVKLEECLYMDEEKATLVLKNGYVVNDIHNINIIMGRFQLPKLKYKKIHQIASNERNNINSRRRPNYSI